MHSDLLLVIVVVAATAFDFTNGFHDTANVVASSISSRALAPRTLGRRSPGPVTRGFRGGQLLSNSAFALAHGTNDAQKTMGVITLALVAHGSLSPDHAAVPAWVVVLSATAIALGTYAGGWRIVRTVGSRIIRMDPAQAFSAQGSGAAVILISSHFGYPLSSTHVISGGVIGAGAAKRLSAVRWGVAGTIALAWVATLPSAGLFGAAADAVASAFGHGALGPLLIVLVAVGGPVSMTLATRRHRLTEAASA